MHGWMIQPHVPSQPWWCTSIWGRCLMYCRYCFSNKMSSDGIACIKAEFVQSFLRSCRLILARFCVQRAAKAQQSALKESAAAKRKAELEPEPEAEALINETIVEAVPEETTGFGCLATSSHL